jgi:phenylacetate-CoA ligase
MLGFTSYIKDYRQINSAQWLDRDRIREIQNNKIRNLVQVAYNHVPYYKNLFDDAGISPSDIRSIDDIRIIPVTTKPVLQGLKMELILNRQLDKQVLHNEQSSGSSGRPFSVMQDKRYIRLRNFRFLRGLHTAGYRFGHKLFLITDTSDKSSKRWLRWDYGSIKDSPEVLLDRLNRFKPDHLYGCTTPLRQLAEYIEATGAMEFQPRSVIATAEMLDSSARALMKNAFQADVFDFYGMTEMGLVGCECAQHNGYHISDDSVLVEYVQEVEGEAASRLVMTNLDLQSMPLIRYETGDVGIAGSGSECACGIKFSRMERVEGRVIDCIELRDGGKLSPYQLTCALEKIAGLRRYQVIQDDFDEFTVVAEADQGGGLELKEHIRRTMHDIIGSESRVSVQITDAIRHVPGRKFRVVESRLSKH